MNDKDREMVGMSWVEIYDSLHQAVQNAGGSGGFCAAEYPKKLTVVDLFNHLATNNVRFYCTKTHQLVEAVTITAHPANFRGDKNSS